jgi:RNA polymerase sigma factor (sigma-70 family)
MNNSKFDLTILLDLEGEPAYNRAATLFCNYYERRIVHNVMQKGLSKADGMDILWSTFCAVVTAIQTKRLDPQQNCESYIKKIIYNAMCDKFRKRKKQIPLVDWEQAQTHPEPLSYSLHDDTAWTETLQVWEQKQSGVLNALKPKEQQLVQGHYFEGKTLKAIAQENGETEEALRQRHSRLLDKLKKVIKRWIPVLGFIHLLNYFNELSS